METTIKLYSFTYKDIKTYLLSLTFILGNLLLPQLCHLLPGGGITWLPIYFFTLIAAYKYGIRVGLLTAILSPIVNYLLFGMPSMAVLPIILIKSTLLASIAAFAAHKFGRVSFFVLVGVVLGYQLLGMLIEWVIVGNFFVAIQNFRIGIPGMLAQIIGGYAVLKLIAKL